MEQIREQVLRPLQKHNRKCCQTFSDGTRFVDHSKRLGFSGRELVEQIIENPYLQYFIGLPKYQETASFDPSALVSFRKRIDLDMAVFLNDSILADTSAELPERKRLSKKHDRGRNDKGNPSGGGKPAEAKQPEDQKTETASPSNTGDKKSAEPYEQQANAGTLMIDATCAPSNIRFPQDFSLLNESREDLEGIIRRICKDNGEHLPRTYCREARKNYLGLAKCRRKDSKKIRKVIRKQPGYVKRDLGYIDEYLGKGYVLQPKEQNGWKQSERSANIRKRCSTTTATRLRTVS